MISKFTFANRPLKVIESQLFQMPSNWQAVVILDDDDDLSVVSAITVHVGAIWNLVKIHVSLYIRERSRVSDFGRFRLWVRPVR